MKEQDSSLLRQIRLITGDTSKYNNYIVFVDCAAPDDKAALERIIDEGFVLNGRRFVLCERSASMVRQSTLSFIDERIADDLDERVLCGANVGETVLAKYYAYRGLMLSSCHCIEGWFPKIIIVPDHFRTIANQRIRRLCDEEVEFFDKAGNKRVWKQKGICEDVVDITINAFDGCGIHHPYITKELQRLLTGDSVPTAVMWRAPWLKGMTFEVNYVEFFRDHGITSIVDVWGREHGVTEQDEPMIIMTESMYKGKSYYDRSGTYADWEYYWEQIHKYDHCIGVAKWNYDLDTEPVMTRGNYQILQDLILDYDLFAQIAQYSVDWIEQVTGGDPFASYCFLGVREDDGDSANDYLRALMKNSDMLMERGMHKHISGLLKKKVEEMMCGKLWLEGCFKLLAPDLIMLMEHIGGLEPNGCLDANEFFTQNRSGVLAGEMIIERNPHICHSEHTVLTATDNEKRRRYCPNLVNVCMINSKSIVPQRLNGADFDGDLVFVFKNDIIMQGIDRSRVPVIDMDDKITVAKQIDCKENKKEIILRSKTNMIGEYSNFSSGYHNKTPRTKEQKEIYDKYIDIISIMTGKMIDHAKTGIMYKMPRHIAKFAKPLPYFMGYRSPYYRKQKRSKSLSNMNRLCMDLERWWRTVRWKKPSTKFDYNIMIDENFMPSDEVFTSIEEIYLDFCKEMKQLYNDNKEICKQYGNFEMNWDYYYDIYRDRCNEICPDNRILANAVVLLCYKKYPKKSANFLWIVASDGLISNIRRGVVLIPTKNDEGEYEYLGRKYKKIISMGDCV